MTYSRAYIPKRFQPVLAEAVRRTCDHINAQIRADYPDSPDDWGLDADNMLDPKRNYGCTWIQFVYEPRSGKGKDASYGVSYIEAYMGDGDDGGPAQLHILAERDWEYQGDKYVNLNTYSIKSIVHEFDTYYTTIYTYDYDEATA